MLRAGPFGVPVPSPQRMLAYERGGWAASRIVTPDRWPNRRNVSTFTFCGA